MRDDLADLSAKGFACSVGFGARPALVIVDFIEAFTDPLSPLGADCSLAIDHANRLIAAARAAEAPVFFSTIRYDRPDAADAGVWGRKITGLKLLADGLRGSQIDQRLKKRPGDEIIIKRGASCFFGTDFITRLATLDVDTLVIAGCTTSGCVRATAVDACQHGLRAIVAREAVADRLVTAHEQSLIDINLKYGDVLDVDAVVAELQAKVSRPLMEAHR